MTPDFAKSIFGESQNKMASPPKPAASNVTEGNRGKRKLPGSEPSRGQKPPKWQKNVEDMTPKTKKGSARYKKKQHPSS
jgi:hypothetical protein